MRNKTSLFKRSLAAVLCLVMVLGMIPALGSWVAKAAEGDEQTSAQSDYITMPITIRDFVSDGMLFEYNEIYRRTTTYDPATGTLTYGDPKEVTITDRLTFDQNGNTDVNGRTPYQAVYNPSYWDLGSTNGSQRWENGVLVGDYSKIRVYSKGFDVFYDNDDTKTNGSSWYCLILDASGNILNTLPVGVAKDSGEYDYNTAMNADYNGVEAAYSVWAWRDSSNLTYYNLLAKVTTANMVQYRAGFVSTVGYTTLQADDSLNFYLGQKYNTTASGNSLYVVSGGDLTLPINNYEHWKRIVCVSDGGQVVKVIPAGDTTDYPEYKNATYTIVMAYETQTEWLNAISCITNENSSEYQIVMPKCLVGGALFIERTILLNEGNTRGFGLLFTASSSDIWHNLWDDGDGVTEEGVDAGTIAGSLLEEYSTKTTVNILDKEGNPYTTQDLHYGTVRTNLVTEELDGESKPVYTQGTVDYLAEYMSHVMAFPEMANGAYNTFFVTGTKMFDANWNPVAPGSSNAVYDLAAKLRHQVGSNGKGEYGPAKVKFDNGQLNNVNNVTTWYDAAFFLLHNTWRDSAGYGESTGYHSLNLVQATNEQGQQCYTFNAKYDGTIYNPVSGVISNSAFGTDKDGNPYTTENRPYPDAYEKGATTAAIITNSGGVTLPAQRFDPLGPTSIDGGWHGYGEGHSLNTYGELTNAEVSQDWSEYYDETNYHLSLEGHAQFVYHEGADQYFTFTGDDDVYLYINNIRVLDIGGAHGIAKVSINVDEVAKNIGLVDGETYPFDFFYLERHGTAANFGIETNIQIVDPSMTTTKTGYQFGRDTGYNGYIDPNEPVVYEFAIENKSNTDIEDLTFDDTTIGVSLSKEEIKLNQYTEIEDLTATVYNAQGGVERTIVPESEISREDQIKDMLDDGLNAGEKIVIYGFEYEIPDDAWQTRGESNAYFYNIVNTTAVSRDGKPLTGTDHWVVQKMIHHDVPVAYHVYEWLSGDELTLNKEELLLHLADACEEAEIALNPANATFTLVDDADGKAKLNADTITYTGTAVGADTFEYEVVSGAVTGNVTVTVYTYDVAPNTYVLDYGLAVELNGKDFGFRANDHLVVEENSYKPNTTIKLRPGLDSCKYGEIVLTPIVAVADDAEKDYSLNDIADSVKYVPQRIINGVDTFDVYITILEPGEEKVTKFTGVQMVESVSIAPASVVYYEDNFPGITYVEKGENEWVHYETVDENGNSVAGTEQSADPNMNYGYDPNYKEEKEGFIVAEGDVQKVIDLELNLDPNDLETLQEATIANLNQYFGLTSGDSNGTVTKMEVKQYSDVMSFEFVGTGFEIISRTTQEQYAIINVQVQKDTNGNGEYDAGDTVVREKTVICESKGGDMYQVPVISITGLTKDTYNVVVYSAATSSMSRFLYIDGIRIYGPLGDDEAVLYYNPAEYQAEIFEVKQLIDDGEIGYVDASIDINEDLLFAAGNILIENTDPDEEFVLNFTDSLTDYLQVGPNNELYVDTLSSNSAIVFGLKPIAGYPEAARTVQIGAHRKSDVLEQDTSAVYLTYGTAPEHIVDGDYTYTIMTGTEMYYTIDLTKDGIEPETKDGEYLILIGTSGTEGATTLAFTNLKIAGYEIIDATEVLKKAVEENKKQSEVPLLAKSFALMRALKEAAAPKVEEVTVNENLTINSAGLRAEKIASGKTAVLSVKASAEADTIVITDAEGNVVELTKCTRKVSGGVATFTINYNVAGVHGEKQVFYIRAYDVNEHASVNTETVTVTIK